MGKGRFFAICALVLAGSFLGGYVANRALPVVHAQVIPLPGEVKATSFTLVDARGNTQATLKSGATGAELTFNAGFGGGSLQMSAGGGIVIRDVRGRVVWRSPRSGIVPLEGEIN